MIHGLQESITHAIALEAKVFWETNSAAAATTAADVFNRFLKPFQQPKTIQLLDSSDVKILYCYQLLNTYLEFLTYWAKDRLALTGFKKQGLAPTADLRDVLWKLVAQHCFYVKPKTILQRFAKRPPLFTLFWKAKNKKSRPFKSPFSRTNKALYHKYTSKYKSVGVILLPLMNSKTIWQ